MAQHCRVGLQHVTEVFADPVKREYISDIWKQDPDPEFIVGRLLADLEPPAREVLISEFHALQRSFVPVMMALWIEADEAGVSFEIISRAPSRALDTARANRITRNIEDDDDGIRLYVEHNPNHHPAWIKPQAEAVFA